MKLRSCPLLICLAGAGSQLPAQTTPSMSAEVKRAYETVKSNLLKAADKMPEDSYNFKPTPDIRSFGEVLSHVVTAQVHSCSAVAGDSKNIDLAKNASKADIGSALQEVFGECDKAYATLTDANASEAIKTPRGVSTRLGTLAGNTTHDVEQYAILSVYLRLKGIIPPSSEKAGR